MCEALEAAGHLDLVRHATGLVLDPYFSATKLAWLLTEEASALTRNSRSGPSTAGSCGT